MPEQVTDDFFHGIEVREDVPYRGPGVVWMCRRGNWEIAVMTAFAVGAWLVRGMFISVQIGPFVVWRWKH